MSTKILPTDLDGLNLILGGGIPAVVRGGAEDESAVLLIRGGAGVGKTPVATQIAGSLARYLGVDVGYACIELLPDELAAQHAGFQRNVPERVIPFPITGRVPKDGCRIFAGILPLEREQPLESRAKTLRPALEKFRSDIISHGGTPRVLVVDSLSSGYGLGPDTERELVDEVCKFAAAEGLILILVEETRGDEPSVWSFAVDLVLALGLNEGDRTPAMPEPYERRLTVLKSRFGPSDPGPHAFTLATGEGLFVMPRPASYLNAALQRKSGPDPRPHMVYSQWATHNLPGWPAVQDSVVLVSGYPLRATYRVAAQVGLPLPGSSTWTDIVVSLHQYTPSFFPEAEFGRIVHVHLVDPYLSQNALLARVLAAVRHTEPAVQRVFVGDLGALGLFKNSDGIMHAIMTLTQVLRSLRIPCLLVEQNKLETSSLASRAELVSFVDVLIQLHPARARGDLVGRSGTSCSFIIPTDQ